MTARKRLPVLSTGGANKKTTFAFIQVAVLIVCVALSLVVPVPSFMTREMIVVLVIWAGVVVLWITEVMHLAVSGFIACCALYSIGQLFDMSILEDGAFSGFSEATVWFVFAGLILGLAMHKTGLAKNITSFFFDKITGSFARLYLVYMLVLWLITYLVPSGDAVTVIMCTLSVGMIGLPQLKDKPNVAKILFLTPAVAAGVLNKSILHGTSAITAAGLMEKFSGQAIGFFEWFIYMLPAQIFMLFWFFFVFKFLFKPEQVVWEKKEKAAIEREPFTVDQKKAAFWLALGMVLWFSDKLTGLRPDIICMLVATGLMLPKVGVLRGSEIKNEMNWMVPIFLGTAFSIVNTLENTEVFMLISDNVLTLIPPDMPIVPLILLVACIALVLHFLTGHTSVLVASIMPVILTWGKTYGISVMALSFAFLWGASAEMLVYQSGAFMIAYAYGHFNVKDLMKAGFTTTIGIAIALVILDTLWWPLFGFAY